MKFLPAFLALLAAVPLRAADATPLHVSAATSLHEALTELQTLYAQQRPEVAVALTFTGSGAIQREIEKGADIDVFISASAKEIFALEKKDLLLRDSIRNIAGNTLVLIVPKTDTVVHSFADLAKPEVRRIAIGEPRTVAVGTYTAETFAFLKLTAALAPKLVNAPGVQEVVAQVGAGEAQAGVVYETDARRSEKIRVAAKAEAGWHQAILYPSGIPKLSKQKAAAREFTAFLTSPAARTVFDKHGFLPPP